MLRTRHRMEKASGLRDRALAKFGFVAPLLTGVFPTRGVGAASFTRATTATVVDFEGNIQSCASGEARFEEMRRVENIAFRGTADSSEDLTTWTPTNATTALEGGVTHPAGLPVTKITDDATVGAHQIAIQNSAALTPLTANAPNIWFYADVKAGTKTKFRLTQGTAGSAAVAFDLSTGQQLGAVSGLYVKGWFITPLGDGWYRVGMKFSWGAAAPGMVALNIGLLDDASTGAASGASYSGDGKYLYATRVMVSLCSGANENPPEYVSFGAPKLNEYVDTEVFTGATWTKTSSTATAGVAGPTGALNATTITATAINGRITGTGANLISRVDGVQYTVSLWARRRTGVGAVSIYIGGNAVFYPLTLTADWQRFSYTWVQRTTNNDLRLVHLDVSGDEVDIFGAQLARASSAGDYFPVGNVYPFHGAMVDGVQYFDYENPNVVTNNVVTDTGRRVLVGGYSVAQFPGLTGAYFSTPDSAGTSITGDIDIRVKCSTPDWTPAAAQTFLGKHNIGSYLLRLNVAGTLRFQTAGTNAIDQTSSASVPFSDGTVGWVRVTCDVDNGAGGADTTFYTSDDGVTWTQLGVTRTSAGVSAIADTADAVEVGSFGSGGAGTFSGQIHRAIIKNGIDGTTVVDFNPREGWTENGVTQSENLALWTNLNSTDSGTKIIEDATAGVSHEIYPSFFAPAVGEAVAVTFRASAAERTHICARLSGSGVRAIVSFNLSNGTVRTTRLTTAAFIEPPQITHVGGGVYECMFAAAPTGSAWNSLLFGVDDGVTALSDSGCVYNGNGSSGVNLHRAQVRRLVVGEQRTTSQYLPTTSSALRGWIDALGAQWTINGAATIWQRQTEGYLPEGAATNLVLQSSNFSTTWTHGGTPTITAGAAYCGAIALDLAEDNDVGAQESVVQTVTFTGDGTKAISFLVKQGTATKFLVALVDATAGGVTRVNIEFTWTNGEPLATTISTGAVERAAQALGNGVWRVFVQATGVVAANSNGLRMYAAGAGNASVGTTYFGGVQAENATNSSSHIPTTTAAVTRNLDSLTYPTAGNFDATVGTAYIEGKLAFFPSSGTAVFLGTSSAAAGAVLQSTAATNLSTRDGTNIVTGSSLADVTLFHSKQAVSWGGSTMEVTRNGAAVTSGSFDGSRDSTNIYVGNNTANHVSAPQKYLRISKVKLTNAELVAITK